MATATVLLELAGCWGVISTPASQCYIGKHWNLNAREYAAWDRLADALRATAGLHLHRECVESRLWFAVH